MTTTPVRRRNSVPTRIAAFVLCCGAVVTAFARPAAADDDTSAVKWSGPADSLAGKVRVRADVSTGKAVDGWVLRGLDATGKPVFDPICEDSFSKPRRSFDVECRWDTTRYSDGSWSGNQRYVLRLEARKDGQLVALGNERATTVDNPAAPPADVTVAYDADGHRAVVSWSANTEPDVERYTIETRVDNDSWQTAGESSTTSFEFRLAEAGNHRFRVGARRKGPDGAAGRPGEWTVASRAQRKSGDTRSADARPATSDTPAENPAARKASAERDDSTADQRSSGRERPTPTGSGAPPAASPAPATGPVRHTTPPTAGAPAFPASSERAFQALAVARPPEPNRTPAKLPGPAPLTAAVAPEPDDGFEQALPYRDLEAAEPTEPAASPDTELDIAEVSANVAARGPGHRFRRLGGLLLIALGAITLALVRPSRRRMPDDEAPASPGTAAGGATSTPEFEVRLERLEAALLSDRTTSWLAEIGQLPTG